MFDIFNNDAFSITRLTLAMREVKYLPSRIGQLGLFTAESIDTTNFAIEKASDGALVLVSASPRGGPGQTIGGGTRTLRMLAIPHFQRNDAFYADEIQQVRAFGSEVAVETMAGKMAMKAARHSQHFALTEEYHRLNVIKSGQLLNSDGSVIYDYFSEFGETQQSEVNFDLDNATPAEGALRKKCTSVVRQMGNILEGLPFTGIHALCGDAFFDDLIAHPEVRETYKGYEAAATLRTAYIGANGQQATYGSFEFGGITFENYRGGGAVAIDTNKCHIFPLGVPDLFKTVYAPADYLETVNRPGQRLYAKQWLMPNDKGVNLEFQMNAIHYCSRPRVLIPGKRT